MIKLLKKNRILVLGWRFFVTRVFSFILILCIPILVFEILLNWKVLIKIRKRNALVLYHWAYGHKFVALDYFFKINKGRDAFVLSLCRLDGLSFLFEPERIESYSKIFSLDWVKLNLLREKLVLYVMGERRNRADDNVISIKKLYQLMELKNPKTDVLVGSMPKSMFNLLSYYDLFKQEELSISCKFFQLCNSNVKKFCDEKTPFVVVHLRRKGMETSDQTNYLRSVRTVENYSPVIKSLLSRGYRVAFTGDTELMLTTSSKLADFRGIDNLSKLFLMQNCKFFIGQHSGPLTVAASMGRPIFITDCFPFWQGLPGTVSLALYKRYKNDDGCLLSIKELLSNEKLLLQNFDFNGRVVDNSEEELLSALDVFVKIVSGEIHTDTFRPRSLKISDKSVLYHCNNLVYDSKREIGEKTEYRSL